MNSAPVQLLPVENGSGYKNDVSKKEQPEIKDRSFGDVLENEIKRESVENRNKTESHKEKAASSKKTEKSEDSTEDKTAAAGMSRKTKVEAAVENLKKGLTVSVEKKAGDGATEKTVKKTGISEKAEKSEKDFRGLKKFSAADAKTLLKNGKTSAEQTAAAAELAGVNLKNGLSEKSSEKAKTDKTRLKTDRLAEGLSLRAEGFKVKTKDKNAPSRPSLEFSAVSGSLKNNLKSDLKSGLKTEKKDSKESAAKLKIVDVRRNSSAASEKAFKIEKGAEPGVAKSEGSDAFKMLSASESEAVLDFSKEHSRSQNIKSFQSSVTAQLKDSLNSQIVKQAGIVVKDNGTGEIKLVMKPESLGKVRIQLSLNDNHIAGRIIVENNIVREIFESNLENLYKAFGSEGFESGALEVLVEGQGGKQGSAQHKGRQGVSSKTVQSIENSIPEVTDAEWRDNAVNMVV